MKSPTKSARWNVRVTPEQDAKVRFLLESTGESLNDFVVRHAVLAAEAALADRRVFVVDDAAWTELQALLDAPPTYRPEVANLLSGPSVLDEEGQ